MQRAYASPAYRPAPEFDPDFADFVPVQRPVERRATAGSASAPSPAQRRTRASFSAPAEERSPRPRPLIKVRPEQIAEHQRRAQAGRLSYPPARRVLAHSSQAAGWDRVKLGLLALVGVLFFFYRGAAGTAQELSQEMEKMREQWGVFTLGLVEWNLRLANVEPTWTATEHFPSKWSYGYTSLAPLPRPPLDPLPVQLYSSPFSATVPLDFPPPGLVPSTQTARVIGIEVEFTVRDGEEAEPRFGWWKVGEMSALGGERVRLRARAPLIAEREYQARIFYFVADG